MELLQEALSLLTRMVAVPSVEGQEKAMGDLVADYTEKLGMTVERQVVEGDRFNVIARATIGKGGKTVVLNSHMDVVPPADGWNTDPYVLTRGEDRAYGRGATDAKGCLTALLMAAKRIIENPGETNGNLIVAAVVDEETYSTGARFLTEHTDLKADYAIVGEPTNCRVGLGHNGSIRPVIVIHGKTAHSSTPEKGISSVRVAAYLSGLVDKIQEGLHEITHPSTGKPSISITMLKAGVKENVLPDWCELILDRRMIPGEDEKEVIRTFEKLCADTEAAFPGAKVEIERYLVTTGPASAVSPDSEIAQIAYEACEQVTGVEQTPYGVICNTDMNHFMRKGIPTIIIGPGNIDYCHKPNEYIEYKELETACLVDEQVIRALLH